MLQSFRQTVGEREVTQLSPFSRIEILSLTSRVTGLTLGELRGPRRGANVAFARCLYYWLARRFTTASLVRIAKTCWRSDHTTVISGFEKIEAIAWSVMPADATSPEAWARAIWSRAPFRMLRQRPTKRVGPVKPFDLMIWEEYLAGGSHNGIARRLGLPRTTVRHRIERMKIRHALGGQNPSDARAA
jgi:hypothetical protein